MLSNRLIFSNQDGKFAILGKTRDEIKSFKDVFTKNVIAPLSDAEDYIIKYNDAMKQGGEATTKIINSTKDDGMKRYLKSLGKDAPASMQAYSKSLEVSRVKTIGLSIATGLLNTALNIGIMALASFAITGVIKFFDSLTTTLEEQREITQKLTEEYNNAKTELESVSSELETTKDRIDELNAKDNLTFVEKDELARLKETNAELSMQKRHLADLAAEKKRQAEEAGRISYEKEFKTSTITTGGNGNKLKATAASIFPFLGGAVVKDAQSKYDETIESIKQKEKDSNAIYSVDDVFFDNEDKINKLTDSYKKLSEAKKSTQDYDEYTKLDKQQSEIKSFLVESQARLLELGRQDQASVIDFALHREEAIADYFNSMSEKYPEAIKKLTDLTADGQNISTALSTEFKDFTEEVTKDGKITIDDLIEYFKASVENMNLTMPEIDMSKTLDDFQGNEKIKALSSAYDTLNQGQKLTLSQTIELIKQYPELTKYINSENGALEITVDLLKEKYNIENADYTSVLEAAKARIELRIKEVNATLALVRGETLLQKVSSRGNENLKGIPSYMLSEEGQKKQDGLFGFGKKFSEDETIQLELELNGLDEEANEIQALIDLISNTSLNDFSSSSTKATTDPIKEELEYLKSLKEKYEEIADVQEEALLKPINDRISVLEKEISVLEKQNDEIERTNELLDAQRKMEEALQRKNYVFRNGKFVYEQDQNAIKEARDNLSSIQRKQELDSLKTEKTDLENQQKEIQDNFKNSVDNFSNAIDKAIDVLEANSEDAPKHNPDVWASIANTAETKSVTDSLIPMGENGFLENGVFNSMQFINDFNKLLGTFSVLPNLEQLSKIGTSELGDIITSNSNQFTISVPVTIQGNADTSTVNLIKNTMDEQMQILAQSIQNSIIQNTYK